MRANHFLMRENKSTIVSLQRARWDRVLGTRESTQRFFLRYEAYRHLRSVLLVAILLHTSTSPIEALLDSHGCNAALPD